MGKQVPHPLPAILPLSAPTTRGRAAVKSKAAAPVVGAGDVPVAAAEPPAKRLTVAQQRAAKAAITRAANAAAKAAAEAHVTAEETAAKATTRTTTVTTSPLRSQDLVQLPAPILSSVFLTRKGGVNGNTGNSNTIRQSVDLMNDGECDLFLEGTQGSSPLAPTPQTVVAVNMVDDNQGDKGEEYTNTPNPKKTKQPRHVGKQEVTQQQQEQRPIHATPTVPPPLPAVAKPTPPPIPLRLAVDTPIPQQLLTPETTGDGDLSGQGDQGHRNAKKARNHDVDIAQLDIGSGDVEQHVYVNGKKPQSTQQQDDPSLTTNPANAMNDAGYRPPQQDHVGDDVVEVDGCGSMHLPSCESTMAMVEAEPAAVLPAIAETMGHDINDGQSCRLAHIPQQNPQPLQKQKEGQHQRDQSFLSRPTIIPATTALALPAVAITTFPILATVPTTPVTTTTSTTTTPRQGNVHVGPTTRFRGAQRAYFKDVSSSSSEYESDESEGSEDEDEEGTTTGDES